MAHTRRRMKGRRESRSFSMLIHDYFRSPEYAALSPRAVKCLVDLYTQFRGNNNGDLCAAWSVMSEVGWRSKNQLREALDELIKRGWIVVTRQGGRRWPSLYGVTFLGINECGNKLDVKPDPVPSNLWKKLMATIGPRPLGRTVRRRVKTETVARDTGHTAPPCGSIRVLGFAHYPATRVNRRGFGGFGSPPHGLLYRLYQGGAAVQHHDTLPNVLGFPIPKVNEGGARSPVQTLAIAGNA